MLYEKWYICKYLNNLIVETNKVKVELVKREHIEKWHAKIMKFLLRGVQMRFSLRSKHYLP